MEQAAASDYMDFLPGVVVSDPDALIDLSRPTAGVGHNLPPQGAHHRWPVRRRGRSLRVGIVEPARYNPDAHAELFTRLVTQLLEPTVTGLEPRNAQLGEPLDLLTCPEGFLPAKTLFEVLHVLSTQGHCPCIHVGLRPDDPNGSHLFSYVQIETVVRELRGLSPRVCDDLAIFAAWLDGASRIGFYNVAAVFMLDEQRELRLALHPKNTPASAEVSALPDRNLKQADFALVVTLEPVGGGGVYRVNMQPLICSDALDLQRDTHRLGPMAVLASNPERVGPEAPEHIDIVSVVTCTPQKNESTGDMPERLTWQPKFREMFVDIMERAAYGRHRNALVVLANPRRIEQSPGGLSGCFVPLPLPVPPVFGGETRTWSYGRADREDNCWMSLKATLQHGHRWSSRGHLVVLDPDLVESSLDDHLISFTIAHFPRDRPLHDTSAAISGLEVRSLGCVTGLENELQMGQADG